MAVKKVFILLTLIIISLFCTVNKVTAQLTSPMTLRYKLVPIENSVYDLLEFYETSGLIDFLPTNKPFTKQQIRDLLQELLNKATLTLDEKEIIRVFMDDLHRPVNGFIYTETGRRQTYTVLGAGASVTGSIGVGNSGSYSTTAIGEPFIAGDLSNNLTWFASIGGSFDRFAPDLFYQSYAKDGAFVSPFKTNGHSYHPYMFDYESMYIHARSSKESESGPIQKGIAAGMIYRGEITGSWFENVLRISFHNQRRSLGYSNDNLTLSARSRRFTGIDIVLSPTDWFTFYFLTGSLYNYENNSSDYKRNIYGYDLGATQKMLTLNKMEFTPAKFIQFSATIQNIWSKRQEITYMMPFISPLLSEVDLGDHDNLGLELSISGIIPKAGKVWFSFLVDEFDFLDYEHWLKIPRSQYAFQIGIKSPILSKAIPLTTTMLSYTQITPFVYTHQPNSSYSTYESTRPIDLSYTHDGSNLGFYLPPNSAEFRLNFVNMTMPNLRLELDTRFIIHGTNDLSNNTVDLNFGDVYRHHLNNTNKRYSLSSFGNDGLYDYTIYTEAKGERKIRIGGAINYFRLFGTIGFSQTRWNTNKTGIKTPGTQTLITTSIGIAVDI
ncbi:MAG: hypothetical protein PF436_00040 [Prolixibacteraceae bacterium]|jgi:hypothetical protein|nr:hypothetical protein [Prolixibacteraceae bacterium]